MNLAFFFFFLHQKLSPSTYSVVIDSKSLTINLQISQDLLFIAKCRLAMRRRDCVQSHHPDQLMIQFLISVMGMPLL